jgi:hypothetical protein
MNIPIPTQSVQVPFEAYIFVTAKLAEHPKINQVDFIQIPVSEPLKDALGNDLPAQPLIQSYTKTDLDKKPIKPLAGLAMSMWKIFGTLEKPWMPGMFLHLFREYCYRSR